MIWGYAPQLIAETEKPLVDWANREQGPDALMRQAAYALYHHTHLALSGEYDDIRVTYRQLARRRILVLVGAGNNGGDGLYAAAYLCRRGYPVVVLPTSDKLHPRARQAALRAGVRFWSALNPESVPETLGRIRNWQPAGLIDAIIGIGARPPLREPAASLVRGLNAWRETTSPGVFPVVVACDHPSGIDLEMGSDLKVNSPVLRADLTVTMGAPKTGMLIGAGWVKCGRLETQSIGLPTETMSAQVGLITATDVRELWPWPQFADHKYSRGVLAVLAGSAKYPGAGILVTSAALQAGESFLRYLGEPAVQPLVLGRSPEVVLGEGQSSARVLGPGLDGNLSEHRDQILQAWENRGPEELVILDAGALPLVGRDIHLNRNCLLTPHAGEAAALARQLGLEATHQTIETDPYTWSRRIAAATNATVLIKGPTTTIANPDGMVYSVTYGTRDLATAGSGDVLAGILGYVFAAVNAKKSDADLDLGKLAAVGAYVHAQAGRKAAPTPPASRIVTKIRAVLKENWLG